MRLAVIGKSGQLAKTFVETIGGSQAAKIDLIGRNDFNVLSAEDCKERLSDLKPTAVVNTAAYTAVDQAEQESDAAIALNVQAARNIALAATALDLPLVHISTDFVFDGEQSAPYQPDSKTRPLGVYGASKREGELAVLANCSNAKIVRTAWLYSPYGKNFVHTMLRLMASREQLSIVADQVGTPTSCTGLAAFVMHLLHSHNEQTVFHWTDAGVASWYDFAVAIQEEALVLGLLNTKCAIHPIPSSQYPTPAKRPAYSVLDKTASWSIAPKLRQHWREALRETLRHQAFKE